VIGPIYWCLLVHDVGALKKSEDYNNVEYSWLFGCNIVFG